VSTGQPVYLASGGQSTRVLRDSPDLFPSPAIQHLDDFSAFLLLREVSPLDAENHAAGRCSPPDAQTAREADSPLVCVLGPKHGRNRRQAAELGRTKLKKALIPPLTLVIDIVNPHSVLGPGADSSRSHSLPCRARGFAGKACLHQLTKADKSCVQRRRRDAQQGTGGILLLEAGAR
jgi:hypothetical protein